ncbi:lipopolysaccharide biosynthesis protein [Kaistella sp. PBT33-4]|uniref:lipopolysaccharide biosynthesis protein n=1 Tax=Kaistella sp. PBT33-4 TaxID=3032000 RepID=UPI0023D80657|nr:lipopolysaccharide biosynthesis protein [Kaistella sp. PBT33-4]MDF0718776.1 lipopolysaccharide biosynthesis protein [Kaistella sp. PBT33-4]
MSLKAQAISGMLWTYSQQFGIQLIQFGVSIVLARLITPEEFGLIGMIAVFMGIGTTLFDGGLTSSLIRTSSVEDIDYSTVFLFNFGVSILIYAVFFVTAPFIANFFGQPVLTSIIRVYSLSFVISSLAAVQNAKLTKELKFKLLAIASFPGAILSGLVGILLAYNGYGVWALVYSFLVQSAATTLVLWLLSGWRPSLQFSRQKFREHFFFGSKLTLSGLLDVIFTNIYQLVIGKMYAPAQVGYYTRANTLMMLPVGNISTALNKVVFPLFSKLQDDLPKLRDAYRRIMLAVIFLVSPVIVIMAVLAKPLILFLFGAKWEAVVPIFQIIAVTGILYPLHLYNLLILQVRGKSGLFLKLEIAKKILMIALLSISLFFGFDGLLWGMVIFSILALFINTFYAGQELRYPAIQQFRDVIPIFLLSTSMGVIIYYLAMVLYSFGNFVPLAVGSVVGLLFYLAVGRICKLESMSELINLINKR